MRLTILVRRLETQNFFLMHLSLFREYLDLEFASLRAIQSTLPFEYDLERIIDDFILLNIFVGNDFLPHLPGLHINEGALGRLFEIYKKILPVAGESPLSLSTIIALTNERTRWIPQRARSPQRQATAARLERIDRLRDGAL